jgi:hypothetical protein
VFGTHMLVLVLVTLGYSGFCMITSCHIASVNVNMSVNLFCDLLQYCNMFSECYIYVERHDCQSKDRNVTPQSTHKVMPLFSTNHRLTRISVHYLSRTLKCLTRQFLNVSIILILQRLTIAFTLPTPE